MTPFLVTILLLFIAGAVFAWAVPWREAAQSIALGATSAAVVVACFAAATIEGSGYPIAEVAPDLGSFGRAPLLSLDGLGLPWVLATAVLTLAVLAAAPRRMMPREGIVATLVTGAATEGILLSQNFGLTAFFWVLALIPGAWLILRDRSTSGRSSLARMYAVLAIGAGVPMIAAAAFFGYAGMRHGLAAPLDIDALKNLALPADAQALPFALLLASVAVRMGLFPFHSWVPLLMERGPIGVVTLLVGVHTGLFVVARVGLSLMPGASAISMPWLTGFALLASVLGAVLALVQTDLARTLGFIATSQTGMVLVGLASLEPSSLHGALLQSVGIGIALTGALLVVRAVEARTGSRDVRHLGGLVVLAPRAAAFFFLFAAATAGFPGSLGFVGEDLLVGGVLHAHPAVASSLLLATALNGFTLFRAFCRGFLGRPAGRPRTAGPLPVEDFVSREKWAAAGLITVLVLGGLIPSPLLRAREQNVQRMSNTIHQVAPDHHRET